MTDPRRALPSVSALLESDGLRPILARSPRTLVTEAIRSVIDEARHDPSGAPGAPDEWTARVAGEVARRERPSLRPVINATGVVLHTNLGRAPLADAAIEAIRVAAEGYSNLEYDLARGERGSRYTHCVALLRELTGAEDALVVNNGAAALVLALDTFARGRDAIVSRGELVEIGGSFRVPDIMAKSGARLVEVGTTNRTHADDYRRAIGATTGALVKVHRSNFAIEGFVAEVELRELAAIGAEHGVPVVHDLGSGLLISLDRIGLRGEPLASDAVRDGAAVVTMSGDKLLGGPQAGIVVGAAGAIAAMKRNPLTRALRVDKLTIAALEATLALYRDPERALREVPALAMLGAPVERLRERAAAVRDRLAAAGVPAEVVASEGSVGGGAFPTARIPSVALALAGRAAELEERLRGARTPVIGRAVEGRLLLDLRSVPRRDDALLAEAVSGALA
jgi:L-seryl-tRNA(Ser) seleniumtransferase